MIKCGVKTQQYQKGEARKIYGCRAIILLCFVITGTDVTILRALRASFDTRV